MKIQELKYIVALAKEKHFGRAANICNVSQPTLSVAIQNIENRLNLSIFERVRHKILLTPIGEKIVAQAKAILKEVDTLNYLVQHENKNQEMPVSIGVIFTLAAYILPNFLTFWHNSHPHTPLKTVEGFTTNLVESLLQGEIDVAILATKTNSQHLVQAPLFSEELVWVLPTSHKLADKKSLAVDEISGDRMFLLGEEHCLRQHVIDNCPQCIQDPRNILSQGTSVETIKQMIASGYGISILPKCTVGDVGYESLLRTIPFRTTRPYIEVYLTWRISFPRHQWIDAIKAMMKKTKAV